MSPTVPVILDLLPLVPEEEWLDRLRGPAEETLVQIADILADADTAPRLAACADAVRARLLDLQWQALDLAWQLRLVEASVDLPPSSREEFVEGLREPLASFRQTLEELREKAEGLADRAFEAIKNAFLDLAGEPDVRRPLLAFDVAGPLLALPRRQFLSVLRPRVEAALRATAEAINEAGTLQGLVEAEARSRDLFARLCWDALELGLLLRLPEAVRLPATVSWAEKYRLMKLAEAVE